MGLVNARARAARTLRGQAIGLAVLLALSGCGHGHSSGPEAASMRLYSPNGEPLSGGKLGHPSCAAAMSAWFDRVDADHDGTIDRAEFLADARRQFAAMDLDGDGQITPAELAQYRAPYEAEDGAARSEATPGATGEGEDREHGRRRGGAEGGRGSGGASGGGTEPADPVMIADTQLRFRVSLADFIAYETRHFDALDQGRHGRLSKADVLRTCPGAPSS